MAAKKQDKRWKVPTPIKVGIAVIGSFFILIALIGTLMHAHGQANMTNLAPAADTGTTTSGLDAAKGCIGNDQTTGKTYIDVRCLQNPQLNQIMCDNWPGPGDNSTCPNTTVPHNMMGANVTR